MIDYKQQAQELFNLLMTATGISEDIQMFNYLSGRYSNLMDEYIREIEEEVKDVQIPEWTEEEENRQRQELMKKIQKIEQNKKTDKYSIKGNGIYDICQDDKNRVWIGCYDGGLNLVAKNKDGGLYFINSNNVFITIEQPKLIRNIRV